MRDQTINASWLLVLLLWSSSCGFQALAGPQFVSGPRARPIVLALGTRFVETRSNGPYLATALTFTLPPLADRERVRVRSLGVGGGYRWLVYPWSFELGSELGAGQPAYRDWTQTGVYLGATGSVLFRLSGDHDSLVGYAPAGLLWDLVLSTSAGVWARAQQRAATQQTAGDFAVVAGVRFTLVSDIAVPSDQGWVPAP